MSQICINASEQLVGVVGSIVATVSLITNKIPAPDQIQNPTFRLISRVLHFISLDIVTAIQK